MNINCFFASVKSHLPHPPIPRIIVGKNQACMHHAATHFDRYTLTDAQLLALYEALRFPRMIEEKMLILLRQGRISKWFSGIGQEAVAVGLTSALQNEDYLLPLHRNLGVFTSRDVPLYQLICQWLGKPDGFTQGRDRSFHFGLPEKRIIGMISHLGAMLPVANGLALASKLKHEQGIAAAFFGDGGSSQGDVHEALNVAAVWELPTLFVVENNGYGLSTPSRDQFRCEQLSDRALGYGMKGFTVDGNNVLEVYRVVQEIARLMREQPQPVLLECMTFRMRGHEEASGTKYVPPALLEQWGQKDPIATFERYLEQQGLLTESHKQAVEARLKAEIQEAVDRAFDAPGVQPDPAREVRAVYAPFEAWEPLEAPAEVQEMRFVDALADALKLAMERNPRLILMGQDIADYGGVFKITQGLMDTYGEARVRNTPLCESGILGMGLGLSLEGYASMIEMQFADFVSCGFNQIVNNLAKNYYRWGHAPQVVIRMPTGGGVGAGPFHSQSIESWFTHVPGLKVVYPATPADAKGLLLASLDDPNPVLFFEHKLLYRSETGAVPEAYYHVPIGKARLVQEGEHLSLITYGLGVRWAVEAVKALPKGTSVEIVDLRSLLPWDKETVFASVKKTGKCLVLYEATQTGAFGAEVAACIGEECFEWLDGPVKRLGSLDTPVPFQPELEADFLASARLSAELEQLLAY